MPGRMIWADVGLALLLAIPFASLPDNAPRSDDFSFVDGAHDAGPAVAAQPARAALAR